MRVAKIFRAYIIPGGDFLNTSIATATEMQNNFGKYLNLVMSGQEIIITKNGHEVGRFVFDNIVNLFEVTRSLFYCYNILKIVSQTKSGFC